MGRNTERIKNEDRSERIKSILENKSNVIDVLTIIASVLILISIILLCVFTPFPHSQGESIISHMLSLL